RHLASAPLELGLAGLAPLMALPGQSALTLLLTSHPPNLSVIDRSGLLKNFAHAIWTRQVLMRCVIGSTLQPRRLVTGCTNCPPSPGMPALSRAAGPPVSV